MPWKVWTFKRTDRPRSETFESKTAAFQRACDQIHIVIRIEGPDGERIQIAEIEKWCRGRRSSPNGRPKAANEKPPLG